MQAVYVARRKLLTLTQHFLPLEQLLYSKLYMKRVIIFVGIPHVFPSHGSPIPNRRSRAYTPARSENIQRAVNESQRVSV